MSGNIDRELKIKDEGYFRNFDLVIAIIEKRYDSAIKYHSNETFDKYYNILMRENLLKQFSLNEKCRIDWIRFYPIEIKSDNDVLDERLRNQILNAILTFGRSVLILDEGHSRKTKMNRTLRLLPTTIIGYTGKDDSFEVLSVFDRLVTNGPFNISKRGLARLLIDNGMRDTKPEKIYRCLSQIQRINQKLAFNEFYDEKMKFAKDEIEFIKKLIGIDTISDRRQLEVLIEQTTNSKITDYMPS
ncbi:MAG TPA: hypothetical protein VE445_11750 [Nitrososphaeraceae archaeon]|nr:hypothetical protein [Nitrososphaeraceae archaeon]